MLDETLTTSVKCQYGLSLRELDRHASHVGSRNGFANSLCVCSIMLIGFDIGLDELRGHQFDVMAHRHKLTDPEVSRSTGFHAAQTWRDVGKKGKHFCAFELPVGQSLAVFVNSMNLENRPCTRFCVNAFSQK
ncbi:hypothetical protein F8538_08340 [Edwardsiella ictaluri]|nr:hypothetical protein F8538_08340 [Edwardsiella ictaluri]